MAEVTNFIPAITYLTLLLQLPGYSRFQPMSGEGFDCNQAVERAMS